MEHGSLVMETVTLRRMHRIDLVSVVLLVRGLAVMLFMMVLNNDILLVDVVSVGAKVVFRCQSAEPLSLSVRVVRNLLLV